MNGSALCLIIAVTQIFSHVRAVGKYTVIAPGTIHSNYKYTIAVAVHHVSEPCNIKVGITGPSYNETKVVEIKLNEIEQVDFEVPELEIGAYNLTAEGVNCLNDFKNSTKLNYAKFNPYVCFQTDRAAYKPGDEVNYRVIFFDKDFKPAKPEKDATVWFEDGKKNRIKEIKDITVTKGVHTGKFKISEYPVKGIWRMGVSNAGSYYHNAFFNVEKYVSPKFVFKIEAPKSVSVRDGDIQVIVRAKYTQGKAVNGNAIVIINLGYHPSYYETFDEEYQPPPSIMGSASMVQGKAKLDLNIKELAAFWPYKSAPFLAPYSPIVAIVEEEFTGVKITDTAYTLIFPYRYVMNCFGNCHIFEANKEKVITLRLSYVDSSNLRDTRNPVEITFVEAKVTTPSYSPDYNTEEIEEFDRRISFRGNMNESGFVVFKVVLPELKVYSHFYTMYCSYLDESRRLHDFAQIGLYESHNEPKDEQPRLAKREVAKDSKTEEPKHSTKAELQILRKTDYPHPIIMRKPTNITIISTVPLSYIDYNVIGRGNILESGHIDLTDDMPKAYNLTLTPTYSWAPRFGVYVYYVDANGEYQYAEQHYNVDPESENKIIITAAEQVKPGEEVALKIKTTPNSFVALVAVDQNSRLLQYGNSRDNNHFGCWISEGYTTYTPDQGGSSYYPGSNFGCVTLTNADYFYSKNRPEHIQQNYIGINVPEVEYTRTTQSFHALTGVHDDQDPDMLETWLFADIENTETEEFTWSKKIPKTLTSWVVSAFSINADKGLGVTAEKTKITTFYPFFISIYLPYAVKRGEVINIPCYVFNYLNEDLDISVSLDNSDGEFDFTDVNQEIFGDKNRTKKIRVPSNDSSGVSLMITPTTLGNILLKYTAVSPLAGDVIHKTMKVIPEGIPQYVNRGYFITSKNDSEQNGSFDLELPEDIVPETQHIEVGVAGDILAPVLNNLDNLVRLPSDCGEQTMSTLLFNYLMLKYLQDSNRLTLNLKTKLLYNIEQTYQHLFNFHNTDGSFSTFRDSLGNDKPHDGSTWLTAYIIRSLIQLKEFLNIDLKIIEDGLKYLTKQQATNGTFTEQGDHLLVSQSNHITLTSSVLLAFLQNKTLSARYSKEIEKASDFIADNEGGSLSLYAQAITTFALNKAKHSSAKKKLSKLRSLAKSDDNRMWWAPEDRPSVTKWWRHTFSNDIEITSYALLSILMDPSTTLDDIFPIVRWLVGQRNSNGGFSSTQDTVIGLTALIEFAKKANYEATIMSVDVSSTGEDALKKETVKLNADNGILYQTVKMPPKTKTIEYLAKGTGIALVQIAYQYNIIEKDLKPSFTLTNTKYGGEFRPAYLSRMVCTKYIGDGSRSNMAVLEINTPSGYMVDVDGLKPINELERVRNTEVMNTDTKLVIYYDHLYKDEELCFKFEAIRMHAVALQKPALMILYDYYEPTKKVTTFYDVQTNLCDICEGEEECSKCK